MKVSLDGSARYTGDGPQHGFTVGFTRFSLVDASRKISDFNRHLELFVWYPADKDSMSVMKSYHLTSARKKSSRIPHVNPLAETNAKLDAPVSASRERYPVIVFSHDLACHPEDYTFLMEYFASEGYVVFSINHPTLSSFVESQPMGGSTSPLKCSLFLELLWRVKKSLHLKKLNRKEPVDKKWTKTKKVLSRFQSFVQIQREQSIDQTFVLDFLEQLNSSLIYNQPPYNLFSKRLDLNKIGILGHGWGGVSCVNTLQQDKRVRAAVNLDGFHFSQYTNPSKPFMTVYSQANSGVNDAIYLNAASDCHTVAVNQTTGFTDAVLLEKTDYFFEYFNLLLHFFDRHIKQVNHATFVRQCGL